MAARADTRPIASRWVRRPLKAATRPVVRRIDDALDRRHGVPVPPWSLRSQVPGDFRAVGRAFLGYMVDLGGLRPEDRLLDIGCRAGRMTIPLTGYLGPDGAYDAVDDWPEGTAWCQQVITTRYPNFRFRQLSMGGPPPVAGATEATRPATPDATAPAPSDATAPAPEPLPYADATFDFVTLGAILQLTPDAFDWYLAEAARVVRPGGTYFGTWFLWNDGRPDTGRPDTGRPNGSRVGTAPAIACTEDEARRRLGSLGLTVDVVHRGGWDGYEPSLSHQDLVIARRAQ
ncbi:MAG TPA: methyltransferase domain-containing protein [Acidimicrobiales bacterium]|nr:methyltransferase domain-containing protein [Acidimicrobiales bacterium]